MKNRNYPIALLAFAFTLVFVLSCQEDEKLETRNELGPGTENIRRYSKVRFDGTEGHAMDFSVAKKWVANYKSKSNDPNEIMAHYFGYGVIKDILNQANCVGIRMYYALDDNGEKKLILVGVDSNGQNLLPSANGKSADDGNITANASLPCPDYCPENDL